MNDKVNITTDNGNDLSRINEAVSRRIKQFRREKKISLDELSRRAGVSKGMLVDRRMSRESQYRAVVQNRCGDGGVGGGVCQRCQ